MASSPRDGVPAVFPAVVPAAVPAVPTGIAEGETINKDAPNNVHEFKSEHVSYVVFDIEAKIYQDCPYKL